MGIAIYLVIAGFIGITTFKSDVGSATSITLYVGGLGPGNYSSIQEAIDNASAGDTIFVYNGTYFENLKIFNQINLVGEDKNTTIIDGGNADDVVYVCADMVNITGFNITNSGSNSSDAGLEFSGAEECRIINNCIFSNPGKGIYLQSLSTKNIIKTNKIEKNQYGIYLFKSSNNNITTNKISSNDEYGVRLYTSSNNIIVGNNIVNNQDGISLHGSSDNVITNNNVSMNLWDGIDLHYQSWYNIVEDNKVYDNDNGISLWSVKNNKIIENIAIDNLFGVRLYSSSYNYILNNNISNNSKGILLTKSSNNNITNNNITSNLFYGISLESSSSENNIIGNDVSLNNDNGFSAESSHYNTISENNISHHEYGIELYSAHFNTILNNNISKNGHSFNLDESSNNKIKANNIQSSNGYGLELYLASDNEIVDNSISTNWSGIYIDTSVNNNITDNNLLYNGIFIDGSDLVHFNTHNIPTSNKVNGKPLYYYKDDSDININGIPVGQLIFVNCFNINVTDLLINNTYAGIEVAYSSKLLIIKNNISNNLYGIYLYKSSSAKIYHNNFIENVNHAYLEYSSSVWWYDAYPSGGNFWSDHCPNTPDIYNGEKMPQTVGVPDGICDDQYQVLISSMDKYPLKYPWGPDNIPPTEPIGLKAKFGDSYVNITWEAPGSAGGSPISNYRIYKGTESGEETYLAQIGNLLFFNDTSVINGVTYYYKISAKNALREGPQSDEISTTPATVPSAPIELNAEAGDSYINVSWNVPFNDGGSLIMNYRIYRGNTSNEFILIAKVGNFLYYEDLNVTNGINYFYKVSAQNSIGEGPLSAEISAIPLGLPSEPKSVIAIGRDSYINIYWESPISNGGSQMINYIIYKSTTPDNESYFTEIGNILYYNDTDVINGITYYYKVGAKNEVGNGPLSNEISATPASVPTAPRNLSAIAGDSFIRLSWNTPQSNGGFTITNYIIYRGTTVGKVVYLTQLGTILSYNDTSVTNGISYYYRVSAFNTIGESALANEVNATPGIPTNQHPICIINFPLPNSTISGIIEINGVALDADGTIKKVEIKIDDGNWNEVDGITPWRYDWDSRTVSNGQHLIYARAYDGKDYSSEVSVSVKINNPQEERSIFQEVWFWASMPFIFMIVILIAMFLFYRRKSKEQALEESGMEESELEE